MASLFKNIAYIVLYILGYYIILPILDFRISIIIFVRSISRNLYIKFLLIKASNHSEFLHNYLAKQKSFFLWYEAALIENEYLFTVANHQAFCTIWCLSAFIITAVTFFSYNLTVDSILLEQIKAPGLTYNQLIEVLSEAGWFYEKFEIPETERKIIFYESSDLLNIFQNNKNQKFIVISQEDPDIQVSPEFQEKVKKKIEKHFYYNFWGLLLICAAIGVISLGLWSENY